VTNDPDAGFERFITKCFFFSLSANVICGDCGVVSKHRVRKGEASTRREIGGSVPMGSCGVCSAVNNGRDSFFSSVSGVGFCDSVRMGTHVSEWEWDEPNGAANKPAGRKEAS